MKKLLLKSSACSLPVNVPKIYGLLAILHHDRLARLQFVATVRGLRRRIADQNLAAARVRLQSRGSVYSIADRGVFRTSLRTDVTDDHFAGVKSHADTDLRKSFVVQFAIDSQHATLHRDRGVQGVGRIVRRGGRRAEERHQTVAKILIECATVCKY